MKFALRLAALVPLAFLAGCTALGGTCIWDCRERTTRSTSLVQYLYPDGQVPEPATPQLKVPLRVGLAFLPGGGAPSVGEQQRRELLETIRQRFRDRDYVADIVVIPETYLGSPGKPLPIDQVARLHALDLLALVSYDQVAYRDENALAVTYLTIVGAYLLPGSRHEVHTLVDLAVVDPATRTLVLRAGGTSSGGGTATLVDQAREIRTDQAQGFAGAVAQLNDNLALELDRFEKEVRAGRANVQVARRDGATGGAGALGGAALLALLAVPALRRLRRPTSGARASRGTRGPASARS